MKLSIVTTVYQSVPYINQFHQEISHIAQRITSDYEIIFVNDGSTDASLDYLCRLYKKDKKITIIDFSRNFGHHKGLITGIAHAKGHYVFVIDIDLEERPELLEKFWNELQRNSEYDVVFGVQTKRTGSILRRYTEGFFYTLFNIFSETPIPKNQCIVRLMTRRYVNALLQYHEIHPVFAGLCMLAGFRQKAILVDKHFKKTTSYTAGKKLVVLFSALTSFSTRPLLYIALFGFIILVLSALMIVYVVIQKVVYGKLLEGWMSLIISIWFFGGLTTFCLGIIGIYLAHVFEQVKNRPYTIIKKIYRH